MLDGDRNWAAAVVCGALQLVQTLELAQGVPQVVVFGRVGQVEQPREPAVAD